MVFIEMKIIEIYGLGREGKFLDMDWWYFWLLIIFLIFGKEFRRYIIDVK